MISPTLSFPISLMKRTSTPNRPNETNPLNTDPPGIAAWGWFPRKIISSIVSPIPITFLMFPHLFCICFSWKSNLLLVCFANESAEKRMNLILFLFALLTAFRSQVTSMMTFGIVGVGETDSLHGADYQDITDDGHDCR